MSDDWRERAELDGADEQELRHRYYERLSDLSESRPVKVSLDRKL